MIIKATKKIYDFDTVLTFGKYSGKRLGDVPMSYIEWMAEAIDGISFSDDVYQALNEYMNGDDYGYGSGDPEDGCWFDINDFGNN